MTVAPASEDRLVAVAGHVVDLDRHELRANDGQRVELRPQALDLLIHLARNAGRVVGKTELLEQVWPGVVVTDDSLVQAVGDVRRAIGDNAHQVIQTVPRRGYRLIADPMHVAEPAAAESQAAALPPALCSDAPQLTPVDGAALRRPPRSWKRWALVGVLAGVVAGALAAWQPWRAGPSAVPGAGDTRRSAARDATAINVAVLPLRALNPGAGTPDGDGLAYMIAGELARNRDLRVMSTLVTAELRREGKSARQIGSSTGARYVVDGSVERRGDRLSLELQLVDVTDDRIMWSGRFEPTAQELPGMTGALIERLSGSLGSTVRELHMLAALRRAPASLDAHARTLRGIALIRHATGQSLREARHELEQASRLDPHYAPAWASLGNVKVTLIHSRNDPTLGAPDLPQAIAEIRHAIALDPMLADSWRMLSFAIDTSQHPEESVRAAERAVELGPGNPDNWLALGLAQHYAGRTEVALPTVEKAISWSPVYPGAYALVESLLRYALQDHERALHRARECMDRAPAYVVCKAIWLSSLLRTGRAADAEAAWPALVAAAPSLPSYRMPRRDTPAARAVEEDLEHLRRGSASTTR